MPPFQTQRRVEFCDTDMAGIVHFSNFFRYMESAEVSFLQSLGISVRFEWESEMLGFPRVSATCDYLSPARFEDILAIAVTIDNIGRKSVAYTFDFSKDDKPVARGKMTCVCCKINEGHGLVGIEIPESLRNILESARD
ncbi:MAG: acyl-CoA thioesterase [Gemmataceae bacterium]